MSALWITGIMFGGMLLILVSGLPIGFGLGGISILCGLLAWGPSALPLALFGASGVVRMFPLACVPMFALMGILMARSGIAEDMYRALQYWLAPVPGSLAVVTVGVSTIIAAMVGGISAATITMGYIALPIMFRLKYDKSITIGCIQGGAALGFLIPPSTVAIIYALLAEESIGRLFAGGLFPGLLLSTLFIFYIIVRCSLQPHLGPPLPKEERPPLAVKVKSLVGLIAPIAIILSVLGTILMGLATVVEASAIGATATLVVVAIKGRLTWKVLRDSLETSVKLLGMIAWIFMGALTFGKLYDALGARAMVEPFILGLPVGPWGIMGIMMLSWIIMGMFLDDMAILFICLPIYLPVIEALGFDPIWFGILYLLNMQMAYLTPPFGYCLFMMKAVAPPDITMMDIYRSTTPFVIIQAIGLAICMIFPEIVLWLPNMLFG